MTFGELVTELIYLLNADGAQVNDTTLRARVARAAQRGCDRINTFRPYARGFVSGTSAMTLGVGSVPSNFGAAGPKMSVWVSTTRVEYVEPEVLQDMLQRNPTARSQTPQCWTLSGQSAGLLQIRTYPPNASALTLTLKDYREAPPILVDRPGALTLAAGGVGLPNGAYTYKVTFVTADGETEGGVTSAALTVSLDQIVLTNIPVSTASTVTSRKLYRTVASGEQHKLLATLADNVTTTYTDNIADGSLGANVPTVAAGISGLEKFPVSHHRTAVLETIYTLLAKNQGDGRSGELSQTAVSAIAQMWADDTVTLKPRRMPRYGFRSFA